MKGIGFRTSLLALTIILLVISVAVIGYTTLEISKGVGNVSDFWNSKKWFLLLPTVMNVTSMALLAVLIIMG